MLGRLLNRMYDRGGRCRDVAVVVALFVMAINGYPRTYPSDDSDD